MEEKKSDVVNKRMWLMKEMEILFSTFQIAFHINISIPREI